MHSVSEVIIVEGRYDKNALSQVVSATIIETSGFGVFNDKQKQKLIRRMAQLHGIVILTDPDGAGLVIRSFIKSCVPQEQVIDAYVPPVLGKEKRKKKPSKEGYIGVEGTRPEVLLNALIRAGATLDGSGRHNREKINKADMFKLGLSGKPASKERRLELITALDLPRQLSADALLDVMNAVMTREEFLQGKW